MAFAGILLDELTPLPIKGCWCWLRGLYAPNLSMKGVQCKHVVSEVLDSSSEVVLSQLRPCNPPGGVVQGQQSAIG